MLFFAANTGVHTVLPTEREPVIVRQMPRDCAHRTSVFPRERDLKRSFPSAGWAYQIVDFIGYGSANAAEGSKAPALTNTAAAIRQSDGCTDTNNNGGRFQVGFTGHSKQPLPSAPLCIHFAASVFSIGY